MSKLIFLGTSSSIPTRERDNTSLLFIHERQSFLIDCPGSITQKLMKVNTDFRSLKRVILTHKHPDHIYGIVSLLHTQAYMNDSITIFSSPSCIALVKKLVTLFDLNKKIYPRINYINVFNKEKFFQNNKVTMTAIKNKHTQDSFGIKVLCNKKSFFYSSDTSLFPEMLKKAGRCNYIIHDCTASSSYFNKHPSLYKMHTSAKELTRYFKDKEKTKIIPVHFLLLKKGEESNIREELSGLKGKAVMVSDFDRIVL